MNSVSGGGGGVAIFCISSLIVSDMNFCSSVIGIGDKIKFSIGINFDFFVKTNPVFTPHYSDISERNKTEMEIYLYFANPVIE